MSLETVVRELGKAIQEDGRFTALQQATAAYENDAELQQQTQELQLMHLKFQQEMSKGEEADQARIEQLQRDSQAIYNKMMEHETMQKYNAAIAEMEEMAKYISGMIGLFFDGEDPATCELPVDDGCTHDCSTCGGCH